MEMNETAQMNTLEGFVSAGVILMIVMLISENTMIITPQCELSMDVQLQQTATDVLNILDIAPDSALQYNLNLTEHVAGYNLSEPIPQNNSLKSLDTEINNLLGDILYNVDFVYIDNSTITNNHVIMHGAPIENSMSASRLITLYNETVMQTGGTWNISSNNVQVVEVRLIIWQI
jgi:hypothetical protein